MLKVAYVKLDKLTPYERNARTHSDAQIAQIAASITEFGFTNPILVDGDSGIIAGHGRLAAAKKIGMDKVPVIELSVLTEAQKRAYIIADNQLALAADWDKDILKVEIEELAGLDFDIALLGFDPAELSGILEDGVSINSDEEGGSASGGADGEFLKWDKQRIPLTGDEIEALDALVSRYVETFGLAHGFARWLSAGEHLA